VNDSIFVVTVLGSSSAIPRASRACSSYLVQMQGRTLLLDFGTGAFANLLTVCSVTDVDAIVISHLHADHFIDIVPLRYALRYGTIKRDTPLPVYVPPGSIPLLEQLASTISGERNPFYDGVIELHEYDPAQPASIAGFDINFTATQHYIDAYSISVEADGVKMVYSGDTAEDDRVITLAKDADLFICEATLGPEAVEEGDLGHCSAQGAARMADAAQVRRLALTHYGAEHNPADLGIHAARIYEGPIDVLDDGMRLSVATKLDPALIH
jgi:ribonuclease BN (tRNA processing enzyme)